MRRSSSSYVCIAIAIKGLDFATSDASDWQYPFDVLGAFKTEQRSAAISTITAESVACNALKCSKARPKVSDNSSRPVMEGFLLGGPAGKLASMNRHFAAGGDHRKDTLRVLGS